MVEREEDSRKKHLRLESMTVRQADAGLRLSRLARWNQTRDDWRFLLERGAGRGFRTPYGLWVASMVALPLGPGCGWISMVLTDPEWRRLGLATRLMESGIDLLESRGLYPVLDATPEGEQVYRKIGFSGDTGLARWRVEPNPDLNATPSTNLAGIISLDSVHLEELPEWDASRSGCHRAAIIGYLFGNRPDLALCAVDASGTLSGYIMGREGDRQVHLGPLVADSAASAGALLQAAMQQAGSPATMDAFDATVRSLKTPGLSWRRERSFTRMLKGAAALPGNPDALFLAAGPELG